VRTNRNADAHAEFDRHDFLVLVQLSPHLSMAFEEEPDFLHRSMRYGFGCHTRRKFKMGDAPTTELEEKANVRSIRSGDVRSYGQSFGAETTHRVPPESTITNPAPLLPWGNEI